MKFIDEAVIKVKAGDGGRGSRHFRREKFVPRGGPDGGDGGHGGSVYLVADPGVHTLLDFRLRPRVAAGDGAAGSGGNRTGKGGADALVAIPPGTEVYDEEAGTLLADVDVPGMQALVARGGRGGKGNTFFKSATNQTPDHAQPGEAGEARTLRLSLKLIADVGLVGLPNAGKSTLVSRLSSARPKIADYPFTTLVPQLGVVGSGSADAFVLADIPGLVPGASGGRGLGNVFLKHVERAALLAHVVESGTGGDAGGDCDSEEEAFRSIDRELAAFSDRLAGRTGLVVLSKIDLLPDRETIERRAGRLCAVSGLPVYPVSAASGAGLAELAAALGREVAARRRASGTGPDGGEPARG